MQETLRELRNSIQINKERLKIRPVLRFNLKEEHWKGGIIPTIEDDNNMI
jgi:hypothetical protein|tara:strand:+ start:153 stop:302 length:150 start_codon:yes stop_codon:yes gene_type:complete